MIAQVKAPMQGVPDAYVPIIKTKISGIPVDFLMARLALSSIPDDLTLEDNNLLRNLDDRCIRSLGGIPIITVLLSHSYAIQVRGLPMRSCVLSRMLKFSVMPCDASSFGHNV